MTQDHGTVEFNGITYTLTQDAYCDNYGTDGGVRYYAHATGPDGGEYRVAWDTTEAWDALDGEDRWDEGDACDWADPVEVIAI
jgi:hypothetical protein